MIEIPGSIRNFLRQIPVTSFPNRLPYKPSLIFFLPAIIFEYWTRYIFIIDLLVSMKFMPGLDIMGGGSLL